MGHVVAYLGLYFQRLQLLDTDILPDYPYRDDGVPLYEAIKRYVSKVVNNHYRKHNHSFVIMLSAISPMML